MDLASLAAQLPEPADPAMAAVALEHWTERASRDGANEAGALAHDPTARRILASLFGGSPFLSQVSLNNMAFLQHLLAHGPDVAVAQIMAGIAALRALRPGEAALMTALRRARQQMALGVAFADIAGLWPLGRITGALSDFACAVVETALGHLLLEREAAGELALHGDPRAAGLFVLGMGKLGAQELNYSSDIDLIVLYDADKTPYRGSDEPGPMFVRLVRNLIRLVSDVTADGYVFRTDLRLRPDPGSTPLAISMLAAETYYESVGQNWERAAMIKARPIAGDLESGERFLKYLRPYIWRKSLDFAAIQDVHSIKRQINAHRGGGAIAAHGHNIKLGRGGIREIEFFAQTQQLIFGGRIAELRVRDTCGALQALARARLIDTQAAEELSDAYAFLRRVEHRLQMIADRQTHTLPKSDVEMAHLARFLGYRDAAPFIEDLLANLRLVERHYAALFEDAPSLSEGGNLVFTGAEDDPDTLQTLRELGFANPPTVATIVRQWHHGRYKATATARARELLTELVPTLLRQLGGTATPDAALLRFDQFLARLPAGVQLFSLFHANPGLLRFVAAIMGSAPRLADHLAGKPALFDAVLSQGFMDRLPDGDELRADLAALMTRAEDFQDALDFVRRWAADRRFQVGAQLLTSRIDQAHAGRALAAIALAAIGQLQPRVEADFARLHGGFGGSRLSVVALGKAGSGEMTVTSDLDLMFVYDVAAGIEQSDGERPLPPILYYTRLSQRFINAITALTNEGQLYEVDMRLRPSGNAGPLACTLEAFEAYQAASAWTWEHMALVRARVASGPPDLRARLEAAILKVLARRRDPERLLREVADMRRRIAEHNKAKGMWDLKFVRGGLFDLDFMAQYLLLRHAADQPGIIAHESTEIFERAAQIGILPGPVVDTLQSALTLWRQLQALLRLALEGQEADFDEAQAPEGLKRLLAQAAAAPSFTALKAQIVDMQAAVYEHYRKIVEEPAALLPPAKPEGPGNER